MYIAICNKKNNEISKINVPHIDSWEESELYGPEMLISIEKEIGKIEKEKRLRGGVIKLIGEHGVALLRALWGRSGMSDTDDYRQIEKMGETFQCDLEFQK